jgi:CheY-like chemotaxis protein
MYASNTCGSHPFRILIVDDLSDNLLLLQTILESEGYEVDTAENGNEALAKVAADPPDLILMDVMMPGMDGYDVTQEIRQNRNVPFIPILMISAHGNDSDIRGVAAGANGFIRKPIKIDQLLDRIAVFLPFRQNACLS